MRKRYIIIMADEVGSEGNTVAVANNGGAVQEGGDVQVRIQIECILLNTVFKDSVTCTINMLTKMVIPVHCQNRVGF